MDTNKETNLYLNKKHLIEEIVRHFSLLNVFSCPDFPKINSYPYYENILSHLINQYGHYSIVYGDVNKLRIINDTFGKEEGDRTLDILFRIITNSFPKNTRFVRMGGDELLILLPNTTKELAEQLITKCQMNLERQKDHIHNSGITLAARQSNGQPIDQLIHSADQEILEIKNSNSQNEKKLKAQKEELERQKANPIILKVPNDVSKQQQEKWKELNQMIRVATDKHIADIRPSKDFRFCIKNFDINNSKEEDLKREAFSIVKGIKTLLEENTQNSVQRHHTIAQDLLPRFSLEEIQLIDSIVNHKESVSKIHSFEIQELVKLRDTTSLLLEDLSRDRHSGLLCKSYYQRYLADELAKSKVDYQVIHFSMVGIRPSNTAYGHSLTDVRMKKTISLLIQSFEEKLEEQNKTFNNVAFADFDPDDIFFIDQGNGDYDAFIPKKYSLPEEEIQEMIDPVNCHYTDGLTSSFPIQAVADNNVNKFSIPFKIEQPKNIMDTVKVFYEYFIKASDKQAKLGKVNFFKNSLSQKPFVKYSRYIEKICNQKKDPLKRKNLEGKTNLLAFQEVFKDCVAFYCNEIENFDDPTIEKTFLNNIFCGIINGEDFFNYRMEEEKNKTEEKKHHVNSFIKKQEDSKGDFWIRE